MGMGVKILTDNQGLNTPKWLPAVAIGINHLIK
jgi:hypothetical protein